MSQVSRLTDYPKEEGYFHWGVTGAFSLHLLIASLVALVAFLTHIKSIEQLMAEGGSIAQDGPAPQETIDILLQPDQLPPPPPTDHPEFIKQVVLPKPVVVPPPPVPVPPQPKTVVVNKPHYTAPKATGTGTSASVSRLVVGSSGFPQPGYPYQAQVRHQTGTVSVSIQFDANGAVADVTVISSSGVALLDSSTLSFIQANWHNESFAGRRASVPIEYNMD